MHSFLRRNSPGPAVGGGPGLLATPKGVLSHMIGFQIRTDMVDREAADELVARYLANRNAWKMSQRPLKRAFWGAAMRKAALDLNALGVDVMDDEAALDDLALGGGQQVA